MQVNYITISPPKPQTRVKQNAHTYNRYTMHCCVFATTAECSETEGKKACVSLFD